MTNKQEQSEDKAFTDRLLKIILTHKESLVNVILYKKSSSMSSVYKIENRDFQEFLFCTSKKSDHSYRQIHYSDFLDNSNAFMVLVYQIDLVSRRLDLHLDEFRKILLGKKPFFKHVTRWKIQSIKNEAKKMDFLSGPSKK